mgnify:CR=1 FL=1
MRIRPYIKDGSKHKTERSKYTLPEGATKWDKEERRNANRSMKKAYRQQLKRETDELLKKFNENKNKENE